MKKLSICLVLAVVIFSLSAGCSKDEGGKVEAQGNATVAAGYDNGSFVIPPNPVRMKMEKTPGKTDPLVAGGPPATMTLTNSLSEGVKLSQEAQAFITVYLTDSNGNPVADETQVNFTANEGKAKATVTTAGGYAFVSYAAGSSGGAVTINAVCEGLTGNLEFAVDDGKSVPLSGGL